MCRSIQHPIDSILDLERMSQQWDHSKTTNRDFEQVEVDLAVLSQELIRLEGFLQRIRNSLVQVAQLPQEQE